MTSAKRAIAFFHTKVQITGWILFCHLVKLGSKQGCTFTWIRVLITKPYILKATVGNVCLRRIAYPGKVSRKGAVYPLVVNMGYVCCG
jgi:hypothetical protein